MTLPTDRMPQDLRGLAERVHRLERDLRELRAARRLEHSTINGTLEFVNDDGSVQTTVGDQTTMTDLMLTGTLTAMGLSLPAGTVTWAKGAVILAPTGPATYVVASLPKAATIVGVRGYRSGGAGATINAQLNGADLLALDLSLSTDATWLSGPATLSVPASASDSIAVSVRGISGTPAYVTIQIDMQGV